VNAEQPDRGPFPDVFADTIGIATHPFGTALTFMLSDPSGADPSRAVARVRMTPDLARALSAALTQSLVEPVVGKGGK
jgi:hypothetical protein